MAHFKPYTKDRAHKRLQGEDVFGNKIQVSQPTFFRDSLQKNYRGRTVKNSGRSSYAAVVAGNQQDYSDLGNLADKQSFCWRNSQDEQPNMLLDSLALGAFNAWHLNYEQTGGGRQSPQDLIQFGLFDGSHAETSGQQVSTHNGASPVELYISNLDASVGKKKLQRTLLSILSQHVMILDFSLNYQSGGNMVAKVSVANLQEAQLVVSQVHRQKLGNKRLEISYHQNNTIDPTQLRSIVIALLQETPSGNMLLFKFLEVVEARHHIKVTVSDLKKLNNVCSISNEQGLRIVSLLPNVAEAPTCNLNSMLYCSEHCPRGLKTYGWEELDTIQFPNVRISLEQFSYRVHSLLFTHMGTLPLLSFPICYEVQFGEPLPTDENGVPLEHLVTCVKNVELKFNGPNRSIKYLQRHSDSRTTCPSSEEVATNSMLPAIASQVNLFCREVVDLLKQKERCQLSFDRFIPAYHVQFGRQCRTADYGFTKLIDLLESIPHVIQILGVGFKRTITLSHPAQMRRFSSDLWRVLKSQMSKQVSRSEFSAAFERTMNKPFNPTDYGLCTVEDLFDEMPELSNVTNIDGVYTIALPKRERTPEELKRTQQFASEVVQLMRYAHNCRILFDQFVQAYHHHFGRQCRLSDYGCTKLMEVFEAIPDTVKISENARGQRVVTLALPQALNVVGAQIRSLIQNGALSSIHIEALPDAYQREYGYNLEVQVYDCADLKELIHKLGCYVQIIQSSAGTLIVPAEGSTFMLEMRLLNLLLNPPHAKEMGALTSDYQTVYLSLLSVDKLKTLGNVVKVSSDMVVSLTPFYLLAAQIHHILYGAGGKLPLASIERVYRTCFGNRINPEDFQHHTLEQTLQQMNFLVIIRAQGNTLFVTLNKKIAVYGIPVPASLAMDLFDLDNSQRINSPPMIPISSLLKRILPPKPDTPPTAIPPWYSLWTPPKRADSHEMNLCIPLPIETNPQPIGDSRQFISPDKNLLAAQVSSPDPSNVPMPDKLMHKTTLRAKQLWKE